MNHTQLKGEERGQKIRYRKRKIRTDSYNDGEQRHEKSTAYKISSERRISEKINNVSRGNHAHT